MQAVDIHIMTHNRSYSLMRTLASIRQFTRCGDYCVIVQDNLSNGEHRAHLKDMLGPKGTHFKDKFYSCNEGRRVGLELVDSDYVVFLDDDVRVSPGWLTELMSVMKKRDAGAVTTNICQDGLRWESGARIRRGCEVLHEDWGFTGNAELCQGGATLYRTELLRQTEYRPEYNGSFEDWDQTLQLTQDLGATVWGSRANVNHVHGFESVEYAADKWRWPEIIESALAIHERWGIKTALRKTVETCLHQNVRIRADLWDQIKQAEL